MFEDALNEHHPRVDRLQLLSLLCLMALGTAFVFSATTAGDSGSSAPLYNQLWFRQLVWFAVGTGAAIVICLIDYHTLARWSVVIYCLTILLLVAVLIFGTVRSGARRWFDLGFFSLQPSEFAKLAVILALANFLSRPAEELRQPLNFWKAIGMMMLPFLLIMKEPDLGSALVLLPTGLAMLYAAGVPNRFLLRVLGGVGILAALFLVDILFAPPKWQFKLESYQQRRLLVYFGKGYQPPAGASKEEINRLRQQRLADEYQRDQALISVGSGGLTGTGWHQGKQTALKFMPSGAAHNDFIFSVIAEEEGFVGSLVVLTLYSMILFTGIRIAGQARDRLGRMIAVGVVTLLFSHVFINIGMNIRIVPVTGIPLPLLSYGGSSVIGSLIALGMLHNVYLHRKNY
jgi:rod shape determining protein RodA